MEHIILSKDIVKKVEKLSRELESLRAQVNKAIKIPKSQVWFWSKTWRSKEQAADRDIKKGKVKTFSSVDKLFGDLHL